MGYPYFCSPQVLWLPEPIPVNIIYPEQSSGNQAEVAHLVERDLAKVEVAGSSPVFRSLHSRPKREFFFVFQPRW